MNNFLQNGWISSLRMKYIVYRHESRSKCLWPLWVCYMSFSLIILQTKWIMNILTIISDCILLICLIYDHAVNNLCIRSCVSTKKFRNPSIVLWLATLDYRIYCDRLSLHILSVFSLVLIRKHDRLSQFSLFSVSRFGIFNCLNESFLFWLLQFSFVSWSSNCSVVVKSEIAAFWKCFVLLLLIVRIDYW